jgi:hypothetical protein
MRIHSTTSGGSYREKAHRSNHNLSKWQVDVKTDVGTTERDFPEKLSVLFVDDDQILRKLFAHSIMQVLYYTSQVDGPICYKW